MGCRLPFRRPRVLRCSCWSTHFSSCGILLLSSPIAALLPFDARLLSGVLRAFPHVAARMPLFLLSPLLLCASIAEWAAFSGMWPLPAPLSVLHWLFSQSVSLSFSSPFVRVSLAPLACAVLFLAPWLWATQQCFRMASSLLLAGPSLLGALLYGSTAPAHLRPGLIPLFASAELLSLWPLYEHGAYLQAN